jgi:hypothetical protein
LLERARDRPAKLVKYGREDDVGAIGTGRHDFSTEEDVVGVASREKRERSVGVSLPAGVRSANSPAKAGWRRAI